MLPGLHRVVLDSDHLKLNKFFGIHDSNYVVVSSNLTRIIRQASAVFESRNQGQYRRMPIIFQNSHVSDEFAAKGIVSEVQKYSLLSRHRVTNFVGRQEQLEGIESFFLRRQKIKSTQAHILILHALGGQGKSQIALEYCQRSREVYRGIFWIPASSKSLTSQAYDAIARELKVSPDVAQVRRILTNWKERCLLVFDNYDKPDEFQDVRDYIPLGITALLVCLSMLSRDVLNQGRCSHRCPFHDPSQRS